MGGCFLSKPFVPALPDVLMRMVHDYATWAETQMLEHLLNIPARPCPANLCTQAVVEGNYHLLQWAHAKGHRLEAQTMLEAVRHGDVLLLVWLGKNDCPSSEAVRTEAVAMQRFDVMRWLYDHCPSDRDRYRMLLAAVALDDWPQCHPRPSSL